MAGGLKEELKYRGEQALDQVDQRGGLIEFHKWFLFRNVPKGLSWLHTLGFCLLIVFVNQAVTGSILAMYYKPDPNSAYDSIQHITNDIWAGWLVRGFANLRNTDLGFVPERRVIFDVSFLGAKYPNADAVDAASRALLERIGALPGINGIGATSNFPPGSEGSLASRPSST